jgi:hypothetical protein
MTGNRQSVNISFLDAIQRPIEANQEALTVVRAHFHNTRKRDPPAIRDPLA